MMKRPVTGSGTAFARLRGWLTAHDAYDLVVLALLIALTALVFVTYKSYAISNDEPVQQRYGELIIAYYVSGFTDRSLFHFENLYLYGGLFDMVAVLVQRMLPFVEPYAVRHVLCGLIGVTGIGLTWATARLLAGARAGAIAAFTLALCGSWYGSMFNHTKDIPFAVAMIGATYFLCRAARDMPKPRMRDVIGFGILLGAALGMRVLGLLMIGYAGFACLLYMQWRGGSTRDRLDFVTRSLIALLPALMIAYLIMIAAWPWSALAPLNPIRGLLDFGQFHYKIYTPFAGQVYEMAKVPRWYVPTYLAIKLPLVMLAGGALALIFIVRGGHAGRATERRLQSGLIAFIAVFPVFCEVVAHGPADTGLRHFLFVVPAVAVLAGIGLDWMLRAFAARRRMLAAGAATVIVVALTWNASVLVRLHPYEYVFYNPLVGGLEGASRRYVTDYWVNIMPEAVHDLETYVARLDKTHPGRTYLVAVCGEPVPFEKEAGPRLRLTENWGEADFFIAPTHMNCDRVLDGSVVATVARLGVPIGVVKDLRMLRRQHDARGP